VHRRASKLIVAALLTFVATGARAAEPQRDLPVATDEPAWPSAHVVREDGESPYYYRARKPIVGIGLRPSVKGLVRVAGTGEANDGSAFAFGFDAHAIGRIGFGRSERAFGLWPEAGYVFSGADGHFASVGIGPASQTPTPWLSPIPSGLSFGIVPHLLLGVREGQSATGLRTSGIAEVYFDDGNAWGLELCHQVIRWGDVTVHEVSLGISLALLVHRWKH
jgi:hypothetical protein